MITIVLISLITVVAVAGKRLLCGLRGLAGFLGTS